MVILLCSQSQDWLGGMGEFLFCVLTYLHSCFAGDGAVVICIVSAPLQQLSPLEQTIGNWTLLVSFYVSHQ